MHDNVLIARDKRTHTFKNGETDAGKEPKMLLAFTSYTIWPFCHFAILLLMISTQSGFEAELISLTMPAIVGATWHISTG